MERRLGNDADSTFRSEWLREESFFGWAHSVLPVLCVWPSADSPDFVCGSAIDVWTFLFASFDLARCVVADMGMGAVPFIFDLEKVAHALLPALYSAKVKLPLFLNFLI